MTKGLAFLLLLGGCAAPRSQLVDVGGRRLWMQVAGDGAPAIVFDGDGAADSSVWATIEAEVRRRVGVRTVVYDRAGLGHSDPAPLPYRIDVEAAGLRRALDVCGVTGPIVLVAHAYGGFIARLVAANDPRVAGVVLVDVHLPEFFDADQAALTLARFRPNYRALMRENLTRALVLIPVIEAFPDTAARARDASYPASLPIIDITPEHSWITAPAEVAALRRAHAAFVAGSPAREAVFASRSGANVLRDRPDVVVDAIARMVERVRGR